MKKLINLIAFFCSFWTAYAISTPQSGLWWNPNESGRGYGIDVQGDIAVITTFAYDKNGKMQWYYSDGKLTNNGMAWKGAMLKVDNGQCLSCPYTGSPQIIGSEGDMTINFTSRTTAILTLPNGRQTAIQRQNFGIGVPPDALLGKWVYIFTVGSSAYADVYNFTEKGTATVDGNGIVIDPIKHAVAELQTKGTAAGYIFTVQTDATFTKTLNLYAFKLDLDEGSGIWVSPSTNNSYNLNVHKIQHLGGLTKMGPLSTSNVGVAQSTGNHELLSQKLLSEEDKALTAEIAEIAARMIKNMKDAAVNQ